ncbi:MAG: hypothetical protein Q4B52_00975 [Tissierellia bacterium]|nr:hypothetical protein [Tissierellia bacterium]
MRKNGFISVLALMLLLFLTITISFSYVKIRNSKNINENIINRKKAIYNSESAVNIAFFDQDDDIKHLLENKYISYMYRKNLDLNQFKKFYKSAFNDQNYIIETSSIEGISNVRLKYNSTLNNFTLTSQSKIENTRAKANLNFDLIGNFLLPENSETYHLIENPKALELIEDVNFNNYDLYIYKNLDLSKFQNKDIYLYQNNDLIVGDKKSSNVTSDSNKKIKSVNKYYLNGILVIEGNIILNKDLNFQGLIILKDGNIIYNNKSKLFLKGALLTSNEIDDSNLEIKFNKDCIDYISDIENFYALDKKSITIE